MEEVRISDFPTYLIQIEPQTQECFTQLTLPRVFMRGAFNYSNLLKEPYTTTVDGITYTVKCLNSGKKGRKANKNILPNLINPDNWIRIGYARPDIPKVIDIETKFANAELDEKLRSHPLLKRFLLSMETVDLHTDNHTVLITHEESGDLVGIVKIE